MLHVEVVIKHFDKWSKEMFFFMEGFVCSTKQKLVEGKTSYKKLHTSRGQYIEA